MMILREAEKFNPSTEGMLLNGTTNFISLNNSVSRP